MMSTFEIPVTFRKNVYLAALEPEQIKALELRLTGRDARGRAPFVHHLQSRPLDRSSEIPAVTGFANTIE